jgi:apolipoprotein D and lipocalin family protein
MAIVSTLRSCIHLLAPDGGAGSIAGMDLSVAGARGIIFSFALWGSALLVSAFIQERAYTRNQVGTLRKLALIGVFQMGLFASGGVERPLQVVPAVDLARYAGKWYEIARLPNRFQRKCASDTSATYTVRGDGKITVVNECRTADGRIASAKGTAQVASKAGLNSKLKVTFFWPFYGDYWVIDLDPDYRWAVVGEPGRKYLWILGRDRRMEEGLFNSIVERIKGQGYDLADLTKTKHGS